MVWFGEGWVHNLEKEKEELEKELSERMVWNHIKIAGYPDEAGQYLVCAPTLDKDKPFISIAWFEPYDSKNMPGWQLLPTVFVDSITHWCEIIPPKGCH